MTQMISVSYSDLMDAQAELQVGLGLYRYEHRKSDNIEKHLTHALEGLHKILADAGKPMLIVCSKCHASPVSYKNQICSDCKKNCKHINKHKESRHFSDDSYSEWTEKVWVCDDCKEWWR